MVTNKHVTENSVVNKPNVSVIHGIRFLSCLWIIFMHSYAISGVFPYDHPTMKYIREMPVLGFFAWSFHAVDVFWILSGFLCEYQIEFKIDKNKSLWPLWFIINRLLRLYPLYLLHMTIVLLSPMSIKCKTIKDIFKAFLLLETWFTDTTIEKDVMPGKCSWGGWSVQTDFHGYIFIVLLSIIIKNIKYKKYFLWIFYLFTILNTLNIAFQHDLKWPIICFGIEHNDPKVLNDLFNQYPEYKSIIPNPLQFYPNNDVMTNKWINYRERMNIWFTEIYFTSITRNGGAILLGSLLAINLIQNYKKNNFHKSVPLNIMKILFSFIIFHFAAQSRYNYDASPLWTIIYRQLFLIGFYLFLNGILNVYQCKKSVLSYYIKIILGNKIWKSLQKCSYAIYLYHLLPMTVIVNSKYPSNVEAGGIGVDNYGFLYLFKVTSIAAMITGFISLIIHFVFEYPVLLFRNQYIQPRYSKTFHSKTT